MTVELSDYYEKMSDEFKIKVPKTHCKIRDMISLYECSNDEVMSKSKKEISLAKVLSPNGLEYKCSTCLRNIFRADSIQKHCIRFHAN